MRVWWGLRTTDDKPVKWCKECSTVPVFRVSGKAVKVSLRGDIPNDKCWILVSADSPADPSNLPLDATPPTDPKELLELVAHDNNLALALL